jgi:cytochrome o ubiquinol oxidase operon protein cyoD
MTHNVIFDKDTGAACGTYKSYIIGFVLSIILTLISFYLVQTGVPGISNNNLFVCVSVLALTQILTQLIYFLHLNTNSKSSWNLLAFIFTGIVVFIFVLGTMWVMYNLYAKMGMDVMSHTNG